MDESDAGRLTRPPAAIVLAAGEGRRMGLPKALLPWGDMPLLVYQIRELIAAGVSEVRAVIGAAWGDVAAQVRASLGGTWTELPSFDRKGRRGSPPAWEWRARSGIASPVRLVVNTRWRDGKCGTIRLGASGLAGADGVLVADVDQPLAAEVVQVLVAAGRRRSFAALVPRWGTRRGHPVLVWGGRRAEIEHLSERNEGLRGWLAGLPPGLSIEVPVAAPCVVWNLNRAEDVPAAIGPPERVARGGRPAEERSRGVRARRR